MLHGLCYQCFIVYYVIYTCARTHTGNTQGISLSLPRLVYEYSNGRCYNIFVRLDTVSHEKWQAFESSWPLQSGATSTLSGEGRNSATWPVTRLLFEKWSHCQKYRLTQSPTCVPFSYFSSCSSMPPPFFLINYSRNKWKTSHENASLTRMTRNY